MSRQMADRWLLRTVGAALVACVVVLFAGCVSTKGMDTQRSFAENSKKGDDAATARLYTQLRLTQNQLYEAQVGALKAWAASLQPLSTTADEGAENRDEYYTKFLEVKKLHEEEVAIADSNYAEANQYANGYQILVEMSEEQVKLANETVKAALAALVGGLTEIASAKIDPKPTSAIPAKPTDKPQAPLFMTSTKKGN